VLIDESTREKLGVDAHTEALPNIELKDFDDSVVAYRLCSMTSNVAEQAFDSTAILQAAS
jgi:class 3 adenylate cyclase